MKVSIIFFANEFKDEKDDLSVSDKQLGRKNPSTPKRCRITCADALLLSFRGLVGGEATIVGSGD